MITLITCHIIEKCKDVAHGSIGTILLLIKKAVAYICGLGHFDLFVNGEKVGDHFLDCGWTLYSKEAL